MTLGGEVLQASMFSPSNGSDDSPACTKAAVCPRIH